MLNIIFRRQLAFVRHWTAILLCVSASACSTGTASSEKKKTFEHLGASITYKNQATRLLNDGTSPGALSGSEMKELSRLWTLALDEARQVDSSVLNSDEPGLGDRYRTEFVNGLELVTSGTAEGLVKGQFLLIKFGDYFSYVLARKSSR